MLNALTYLMTLFQEKFNLRLWKPCRGLGSQCIRLDTLPGTVSISSTKSCKKNLNYRCIPTDYNGSGYAIH